LLVIMLLCMALMFSRMENMFSAYAKNEEGAPLPEKSANNLYIYLTPALIVPTAVFIIINALL